MTVSTLSNSPPRLLMEGEELERLVEQLGENIGERVKALGLQLPLLVGIQTGGNWIAQRLRPVLGYELGELNISFYRDDFSHIGLHPRVGPSRLPPRLDERHVVLVDDVLFTGRTVRAALNELFDYGRPAGVSLAVLFDRPGRELPIQPDVCGKQLDLTPNQHVKLKGPQPLQLILQEAP